MNNRRKMRIQGREWTFARNFNRSTTFKTHSSLQNHPKIPLYLEKARINKPKVPHQQKQGLA